MKESVVIFARTVLIDAGPLIAAIDKGDRDHPWATVTLPRLKGRFVTCEAVVAEALHALRNAPAAIDALKGLAERLEISPVLASDKRGVFARLRAYAPRMDLADACLVALAASQSNALVVTTDTADFSSYGVPFLSPAGLFRAGVA